MGNRWLRLVPFCVVVLGMNGCVMGPAENGVMLFSVGDASIAIPLTNDECGVTTASVTISGAGISVPMITALTVGTSISGTVDDIPVGTRQFFVQAFDSNNLEVYKGGGSGTILDGQSTAITIVLGRNTTNCPVTSPSLPTGSAAIDGSLSNSMVYVEAGDFIAGDWNEETTENLDDFLIDIFEVTAGEYKDCVDAGACTYTPDVNVWAYEYHTYENGMENHPMNLVTWNQADAYCAWANKRLPTALEWEKAARGVDGRKYSWGEDAPDGTRSNYYLSGDLYEDGSGFGTTPVGYFNGVNALADGTLTVDSPSPYGAYDMEGNAYEWTASWGASPSDDEKILKGGTHGGQIDYLVLGYSYAVSPDTLWTETGFRCAQ